MLPITTHIGRIAITLLLCLLTAMRVSAQQTVEEEGIALQTIKGHVADSETGEPLPYASVSLRPGRGTLTNRDGNFAIQANEADTLSISYVGYQTLRIRASKAKGTLRLRPFVKQMGEVNVKGVDIPRLVEQVIGELHASYRGWKTERDLYFLRMTFCDDIQCGMLEAFVRARSAVNLRKMMLMSGIVDWDFADENNSLGITSTNVHRLLQMGPRTYDSERWISCIKPFESLKQTQRYYEIEAEVLQGGEGDEDIVRLRFKRKEGRLALGNKGLMVGEAYVARERGRLLRFDGNVQNQYMRSGLSRVPEAIHFSINYDYTRGFARPSSIAIVGGGEFTPNVLSPLGKLHYRAIMFQADPDSLFGKAGTNGGTKKKKPKGHEMGPEMLSVIQKAGFDNALWNQYDVIRRTQEEERIAFGPKSEAATEETPSE